MKKSKWSRGVAVVGAGMSKFGAFPDITSRDLLVEAYLDMKKSIEKDFYPSRVEALICGQFQQRSV